MKFLAALSLFLIPVSLWAEPDCKDRDVSGVTGIPRDGEELVLKNQIRRYSSSIEDQHRYVVVERLEYGERACDGSDEIESKNSICKKIIEFSVYDPPRQVFIAGGTSLTVGRSQADKRFLRLLKDGATDLSLGKPQLTCFDHKKDVNGTSSVRRECRDEDFEQLFVNKTLEQCQHRARTQNGQRPSRYNNMVR